MFKGKLLDKKPEKNSGHLNLSVSKVKSFQDCKLKFKFAYIDKLPQKDWEFTHFGKFLHSVLEFFHLELRDIPDKPLNLIMKDAYVKAKHVYASKLSTEKVQEIKDLCSIYLKQISELRQNDSLPDFLAAEQGFNVDIDGTILLNGFIDKVQLDKDKIIHVADYKTSKDDKYLKNDFFQLKTYAYVMFLSDPTIEIVRTSYIMAKMNFKPIIKEFTKKDVLDVEEYYLEKAALIKNEQAYKPKPSPLCEYCSYLDNCVEGAGFLAKKAYKSQSMEKISPVEKNNQLYSSEIKMLE